MQKQPNILLKLHFFCTKVVPILTLALYLANYFEDSYTLAKMGINKTFSCPKMHFSKEYLEINVKYYRKHLQNVVN